MAKSTAERAKDPVRTSAKAGTKKSKDKLGSKSAQTSASPQRKTRLRSAGHARAERRFAPKASAIAVASALATSNVNTR